MATNTTDHRHTVLLALCGMSPAVITETVWALARETPPVRLHRIVVLTTVRGRAAIRSELFESGVWAALRGELNAGDGEYRFGDTGDSLRVFPSFDGARDLDDILTSEDSVAVGDFVLENLRQFTESANTRVVCSLAGGRKTMSALAALSMTLLGRPDDRLCHVLVPPPFDSPRLDPKFFFPQPGVVHRSEGRELRSEEVAVSLHDIAYVHCRHLFPETFGSIATGYRGLVGAVNETLVPPTLTLNPDTAEVTVNETTQVLSETLFLMLWMLCENRRTYNGSGELLHAMEAFRRARAADSPGRITLNAEPLRDNDEDVARKRYSALKKKLADFTPARILNANRQQYGIVLPPENVRVLSS